jgi:hypothetical protein
MMMEEIVMDILSRSNNSNLGRSLKITTVKNQFGLFTNQITSSFNISNLNSPINMEKFQQLLNEFNEVDKVIEPENRIKNSEGN